MHKLNLVGKRLRDESILNLNLGCWTKSKPLGLGKVELSSSVFHSGSWGW